MGEIINENLKEGFANYAKFGDSKASGKCMTSKNFDKWLKESKVIDGKRVKSTDSDIAFTKILAKKPKGIHATKTIEFCDLDAVLNEIASHVVIEEGKKKREGGVEVNDTQEKVYKELVNKISECKIPKVLNIGTTNKTVVDRLTDTSRYTGTHKERFTESGKGKGIDGRQDRQSYDGYVQGFKKG